MSERSRIALLRARLGRDVPGVRVGIGDDAAVLEAIAMQGGGRAGVAGGAGEQRDGGALVWTVDAQVEGTHFTTDRASWEDVGWRSLMAAASDIAAMGAEPVAALAALVLAPSFDDDALDALARGQAAASLELGAPIVGGNLARGLETSITTTVLGRAVSPVLRVGARAGDGLWLAGDVGLAGAGFGLVSRRGAAGTGARGEASDYVQNAFTMKCLQAWLRPVARIADGRQLSGVARAAIDVSDGLVHDAWHLAEASGVRVVLEARAILEHGGEALAAACLVLGRDPLELALHGGEDYALLAASAVALPGFVRIGSIEATRTTVDEARVWLTTDEGTKPLERRGFDHFG